MERGGDDVSWLLERLEEHHERATLAPAVSDGAPPPPRPAPPPPDDEVEARPPEQQADAGPLFVRHLRHPAVQQLVRRVRALLLP